jgi:gamma-glutamyltranspeptidase/glutathione hydrolase
MAGIAAMHARFGRLPFADLFQPAIWYADKGVTVTPRLAGYFKTRQPALWRMPEGRRFASMPDGSLPKSGDLFRQPELARTLRSVAAHGAAYMYTGDWARAFVAAVQAEGGKATLDDLAHYRAQWREPLTVPFEGATLFAPGEDALGSCPTLEALNLLSGMHVETLGPYWRDPAAFRAHMRALWFAEYARDSPDVASAERQAGFNRTCADRLTPRYAGIFGPSIEAAGTSPQAAAPPAPTTGGHTEAVIVVDRWGNVAAFVHTINTVDWGDTGIVVGGIPISDAAAYYKPMLVGLKPGDRLPNGLTPVIALKDGKPVLAVASVGLSIIPETVRLVTGVLAGHDDPATLMASPPLLNIPGAPPRVSLWQWPEPVRSGAYDAATLKAFADAGVPTQEISSERAGNLKGTAVMAVIDPKSGEASAVEVPNVFDVAESEDSAGPPPPKEVAVPADVLDRYVGDYKVTLTTVSHVLRQGDHLYVDTVGRPRLELYARSPTDFFEKVGDWEVVFAPDAEGRITMILRQGGFETVVPRRAAAQATPVG